ncbi:MAG: hypothetical protein EBR82_18835 [Caulobacteraceae bacterium]|nr:hypothetical protein [Caulobacteraceae bacterium]
MASVTLTEKQLRSLLRKERRVASRQAASRRQTPAPLAAGAEAGPGPVQCRLALPLGVDLDGDEDENEDDDELGVTHQSQSVYGTDSLEHLAAHNPACLTQAGYPYTTSQGATMAAKDPGKMSATFVVVTRQKDPNRHGNMVQILPGPNGQGLQIEDWAANPVVLFDHGVGLNLPIGTAMKNGELFWNAQKSKATSTVFFSQTLPEAAAIYALIDEGILRASSIQFMPSRAMRLTGELPDRPKGVESLDYQGYDFVESKLLEWSVVAIPADPGALRKSLDSGRVAGQRIGPGLRYALAQHLGPQKAWTPGVELRSEPAAASAVDAAQQKATLAHVIDGNALAEQYRQSIIAAAPAVDHNAIAEQVRLEVQRATASVLEGFRKLSSRVQYLAGN